MSRKLVLGIKLFFIAVAFVSCNAQSVKKNEKLSEARIYSVIYTLETVAPITVESIQNWSKRSMYSGFVHNTELLDRVALFLNSIKMQKRSDYCPNDRRMVLFLKRGNLIDTLSFAGNCLVYNKDCYWVDSTMPMMIGQELPNEHFEAIKAFFRNDY